MLVLTRKEGESILIKYGEEEIEITIIEIKNNSVRIGIDADEDFVIVRKEIAEDYNSIG